MANEEQLAILKQGVEVWNKWRIENFYYGPRVDLTEADLSKANLSDADFRETDLSRANLSGASLSGAKLILAKLNEASLSDADLSRADLSGASLEKVDLSAATVFGANFYEARLSEANLSYVNLREAHFYLARLSEANLQGAHLFATNLSGADFNGSDFSKAQINDTVFGNSDLSQAVGLEDVLHLGPSRISTDTFARSKGNIPEIFLRGCGLSDWEIEGVKLHNPNLSNEEINKILYKIYDLRATQALQISPLFISYSHADNEFADEIGDKLAEKGIRYWRDIYDMKAGRVEKQIVRAIQLNPTVLLILSENSLKSDWVEHEVREARTLEKEMGRDVLCPVALDDSWKSSHWPKRVMEQIMEYNILDFSGWEDDVKFETMFRRLIDGLELFYKG